jgi:plastocyanin
MRSSRTLLSVFTASLIAVTIAAGGCSGDDGASTETGSTDTATETGGEVVPGSAAIAIAGSAFAPTTLSVASGSTDIEITNADSVDHTFTLDDMSVDETIPAGGSATVTVDLTESSGFHCEIHPSMTGTLQVA